MYAEAYKQKNRTKVHCTYVPITVDDMLADYNRNFKKNWTANKAQAS